MVVMVQVSTTSSRERKTTHVSYLPVENRIRMDDTRVHSPSPKTTAMGQSRWGPAKVPR